ncbi:glycosyltransferase family 2 protein [Butyrivibrio sp. LC3010]|uniref:glycosyltransferase family 2 protein n=1 Tax=Butyrivibrio sp. LC3010 TaxID=1280680 RepID=UPI0004113EE8|nr:glycosyltransferase [Butyrivibrio sp. LC3010]
MMKKVSIVVPIYNGEKYIDNCVKNLLKQSYSNFEIILVDDGSVDNTAERCDYYSKYDTRIKSIHQKNSGVCAARNFGTDAATGDYLLYIDVDDDIVPNLVEDNVKLAIENDADVVFYSFWYHDLDSDIRTENTYEGFFSGNNEEFFITKLTETIDHELFNAPWNKLFNLEFVRKNNLRFVPEYTIYEDITFSANMLQFAKRIVINPNRYYVYYIRKSGSGLSTYSEHYFDSVTRFYNDAMAYCSQYSDNEFQKNKFTNLYIKLVTTNLKQISCRKQFTFSDKISRISDICDSKTFRDALGIRDIERRKKLIKFLVLSHNKLGILLMYSYLGR